MKITLRGLRKLDFKTEDGSIVKGTQLFMSYEEDGILGEKTDKLFVRDGFELPTLTPGGQLDIAFTNKGKPESIKVIPASGPSGTPGK